MLCNSRKITTDFQNLYHHGGKEEQWNSCSVALFDYQTLTSEIKAESEYEVQKYGAKHLFSKLIF